MTDVWTHSRLEAAICDARLHDAGLVRYGKAGPSRQGQAGHRFLELYLTHLFKVRRPSDMEEALRIWNGIKPFLSPDDDHGVTADVEMTVFGTEYPWVSTADSFSAEAVTFQTLDGQPVSAERVHLVDGPVFRVTIDAAWDGVAPDGSGAVGRHILDWKWMHWIEHVKDPDINRQLLRYASAIHRKTGCHAWLGFPRRRYVEGTWFSADQLAEAWQVYVVQPIQEIRSRSPAATMDRTVGAHCRDCDLRRGCDAALRYPYELYFAESMTREQTLVAFAIVEKMWVDYQDLLREHVHKTGDFRAGDGTGARLIESEKLTFPKSAIDRVLLPVVGQAKLDEILTTTKSRVEKIMRDAKIKPDEREGLWRLLKPLATENRRDTKLHVEREKSPRKKKQGPAGDEGFAELEA